MFKVFYILFSTIFVFPVGAARDLDNALLTVRGAQALPQICPIMVVAKVEKVNEEKSTNGEPPTLRLKVVESIWGHLKKNQKVTAMWLPLESVAKYDAEYESWAKHTLKTPLNLSEGQVVLGLFPSEKKKEYEFVIKPLCRYLATDETKERLNCLREKRCHDFLPGRLVIR